MKYDAIADSLQFHGCPSVDLLKSSSLISSIEILSIHSMITLLLVDHKPLPAHRAGRMPVQKLDEDEL